MRPYISLSISASVQETNHVSGSASALFVGGFSILEMGKVRSHVLENEGVYNGAYNWNSKERERERERALPRVLLICWCFTSSFTLLLYFVFALYPREFPSIWIENLNQLGLWSLKLIWWGSPLKLGHRNQAWWLLTFWCLKCLFQNLVQLNLTAGSNKTIITILGNTGNINSCLRFFCSASLLTSIWTTGLPVPTSCANLGWS